jgi:hypothetical protein
MATQDSMNEDKITPQPLKKPPTVMPTNPESLFLFLAYGEMYEGESEEDFSNRKATLDILMANMRSADDNKKRIIVEEPLVNRLIKRL